MKHLLQSLTAVDKTAKVLVDRPEGQWARSRLGIVGIIDVGEPTDADSLRNGLQRSVAAAHACLDSLSPADFSHSDVWNLLLFVRVPWTKQQIGDKAAEASVLMDLSNDLRGSRKVVLWKDTDISDYFWSRMGSTQTLPLRPVDPLREALRESVCSEREMQVMELLFTRRFSKDQLEDAIEVLAKSATS